MRKDTALTPQALKTASGKSYEICIDISTRLNARLESSSYPDTYTYYHLQHLGLVNSYNAYNNKVAARKSATVTLANLFGGLPAAAYTWGIAIEAVYPKGSAGYVELLPKGRTVFSTGKQTTRINALAQLSLALTGITALAAVKTSVDAYLANINTANNTQKGLEGAIDAKKKALDDNRTNAVQCQIYVLGQLMQEFNNDDVQVNSYFPMDLIRRPEQKQFTGTLAADTFEIVTRRTQKPGTFVNLKSTDRVGEVLFYLSDTKFGDIPDGTTPIVVTAGRGVRVPVEELGNLENKFLIVRNNTLGDASWELAF